MFNRSKISMAVLLALPLLAAAQSTLPSPDQADSAAPLQTVVVEGKFIAAAGSSAMKQDLPVRDTPFSVSTYTNSFMSAIDSSDLADLYKYMTGIQRAGATGFDMSIRGFKTSNTDRNAIMVDGLPGLVGRFGSPPTIGLDHVEVVKGPASVLYGQAQPGGFVNMITKKPLARAKSEFNLRLNTFSGYTLDAGDANGVSASVDTTGPVDAGKRLRYRFIAETSDGDGFRDDTHSKSTYVAPSLSWQLAGSTTATIQAEYRKSDSPYDRSLPVPGLDLRRVPPITTRYQQPNGTQSEKGTTVTLNLVHEFANDMTLSLSARDARSEDRTRGFDNGVVRANGLTMARRAVSIVNTRNSAFWDASLSMPFNTGSISHKAITGLSNGRQSAQANRLQFFNGPATGPQSLDIKLYEPNFGAAPLQSSLPAVNPGNERNLRNGYTVTRGKGAYIADLMTLTEQWKINLGLRYSVEEQYITDLRLVPFTPLDKSASKTLPMTGLLYQPTKQWTLYSSYSQAFVPAPAQAIDTSGNNPFAPETSSQIEIGAKADLLDGKLQATVALFDIKKKNTLSTFTCALGSCSQQIGGERSKGVEVEVNAQLTKNWQIAIGGSHLNPRIESSLDPAQVGALLENSATDNAHLWSRHDIDTGLLKGVGVGFGLSYVSERAGTLPSAAVPQVLKLPAFTVADLGLYYVHKNYELTFKVSNLFDKLYWESSGSSASVQLIPGAPRSLSLSLRARY
ncbi:MAG: ferrichrome-iron receptor [Massilia sp.]|nr:ferrichrome-iron receptor [Massilia sp.]MDB5950420.1 ferrichrome-iron receptor [Massilia sp.]